MLQTTAKVWNEIAKTQSLETRWARRIFSIPESQMDETIRLEKSRFVETQNVSPTIAEAYLKVMPLLWENEAIEAFLEHNPEAEIILTSIPHRDYAMKVVNLEYDLDEQQQSLLSKLLSESPDYIIRRQQFLNADEEWLVRLFRCLPEDDRHESLVKFGKRVVLSNFGKNKPILEEGDEYEDWKLETVREAIRSVKPFHDVEHAVGDWWQVILESLFQEGEADVLLGTRSNLDWSSELLVQIMEETAINESIVFYNVGDPDRYHAEDFLPHWRAELIATLEAKAGLRSSPDDGSIISSETEGGEFAHKPTER